MNRFGPFSRFSWENVFDKEESARLSRLLVSVDLSPSANEVLQYAGLLAKRFDAVVQFLHVVQLNIAGEELGAPRSQLVRQLADEARRELHSLIEKCWDAELISAILIREGRPHEVIVQQARLTNASFIIMGCRTRPWISRLLRPNVLARVIRNAPCPVLAVRFGGALKPSVSPVACSTQLRITTSLGQSFGPARI